MISKKIFYGLIILAISIIFIGLCNNYTYPIRVISLMSNNDPIQKIEVDYSGYSKVTSNVTIIDSVTLYNIQSLFKQNKEISVYGISAHTEFMNINVYKNGGEINVNLLNTNYNGWIIAIANTYYKNDSLILLFKKVLSLK